MNPKLLLIVRIIFGLGLLLMGTNKLFQFMDSPPPASDAVAAYWTALMSGKIVTLIASVEIASGLSLLLNKFAPLMMLILMSVSVNAVLYHITLDPGGILMGAILLILNILMLYAFKDRYKDILRA